MEQTQTPKTATEDENVSVSVNHCVNTNRTYIYELKNGQIVNEKTIHGV
jgi:hypothetical protein